MISLSRLKEMEEEEMENKIKELEEKLSSKEQECEELEKQLELNTANAVVIDMAQRLYKLKQTLTEIKEIAEVLITITDEYDNCYHKSECVKCLLGINGDCQYIKVEQILQKISEVEDD